MTENRASDDTVDTLHGMAAEILIEQLNLYRLNVNPETGLPAPLPVPPQLIAQVLKFLKDNGVDSPRRAKAVQDALKGRLPSFDDVEAANGTYS